MSSRLNGRVRRMLTSYDNHRREAAALAFASLAIVFAVAVMLHGRGIAATHTEQVLDCQFSGVAAHTHDESCYDASGELICPLPEVEAHIHTDDCYTETTELTCGMDEHLHDESCYNEDSNLVCGLPEHTHDDSCYHIERELTCGKEEVATEHVHGPGCFRTVEVEDEDALEEQQTDTVYDPAVEDANAGQDATEAVDAGQDSAEPEAEAADEEARPAQHFDHTIKNTDGELVLRVDVDAPEGALPEASTMTVAWVDPATLSSKQQKAVADAVAKKTDGIIYEQQAVDISFADAKGEEVKPQGQVAVTFTSRLNDTEDLPLVAHIDDLTKKELKEQEKALEEGKSADEAEPKRRAQVLDQLSEHGLEHYKIGSLANDQLAVACDEFSVFVLNLTTREHAMRAEGETVRVDVTAPAAAGLPADAALSVTEVSPGTPEYEAYAADALAATGADMSKLSRFFDIKIYRADGTEVEPKVPVKVKIKLADAPAGEPSSVVHFGSEAEAGAVPEVIPAEVNNLTTKFEAESFSVYGVVYTTDIRTYVITDSGDTYEVTVTYDSTAGIPEDAELRVREITEEDARYAELQDNIANNLENHADKIPNHPLLLDISIWANGQEVEPAEGSEVKVEVKLVKGAVRGRFTDEESPILANDAPLTNETSDIEQSMQVIHQAGDGSLEVMETADAIAADVMVSEFTTDSFSDWLVFLDEDLTNLTLHEGDTLTLRPYTEWVWKKEDMQGTPYYGGEWIFPNSSWRTSYTYYPNRTVYTSTANGSGSNIFRSFQKTDNELNETYTVVRSDALKPGEFDIQTNKGKVIHVTVLPGTSSAKPATVQGLTGIPGLAVNLFDYDVPNGANGQGYDFTKSGSLDIKANTANLGHTSWGDYGINKGHDLKILGYGGSNYPANGRERQWFAINDYTHDNPSQGIVLDDLSAADSEGNRYPVLGPSTQGGQRSNPSLKYLFDPASHDHNVYAFAGVDGLFQRDNLGYYYYNSNVNYAEVKDLNTDHPEFVLYEHTYSQNTGGSNGANAKPIGFFPFHEYDTSDIQPEMNFNGSLNHHFGMSMSVDFEIPADRRAPDDHGYKHDIIYEFSGDDDLWVFVDGKLALDIGGIHQPVTGQINFTTGEITVHGVDGTKHMQFDVGPHKLQMFYMERGGCDSNLSVRFNLPLILGDGNVTLKKKDETKTDNLRGAVFGVWDNPECSGDPYTVATSDENGIILKDLPIKAANQMYYLQEMVPPEGYIIDKTIYTLKPVKISGSTYKFEVYKGEQEVTDIEAGPAGDDNTYTVITNKLAQDIEVGVQKVWQNADGSTLDPNIESATFTVKRHRTYTPENSRLINIRLLSFRRGQNGAIVEIENVEFDHIYATKGDTLTITYKHAPTSDAGVPNTEGEVLVRLGSRFETAFRLSTSSDGSQQNFSYTVNEAHILNGTVDLLVDKAFTDWCNGYEYANGENPHFTGFGAHAHTLITEDDPDFTETITVTRPDWRGSIKNLPVFERFENGDVAYYYYDYYVEEPAVPEGYEVIYYKNGVPSTSATSPNINQTGDFEVVNRKLLDVPIEKEWANFGGDTYTWTAYFQLEQMEVKVNSSDPDAEDAITSDFKAVPGRAVLAVSKGQSPQPKFTGLPMYRVHSNGTRYRIIYSVDEIGFTVRNVTSGAIVEQWGSDGTNELEEIHMSETERFVPIYYHDAGETSSSPDDYEIVVINDFDHRKIFNTIDLTVNKVWPQGSGYATSNTASASFLLKRYVRKEYRDYHTYTGDDWVTITLDTGLHAAGEEHILETITVPRGTTMHIVGRIKSKTNANSVVFDRKDKDTGEILPDLVLTQNNPNDMPMEFALEFTASQSQTIDLAQGDNYVVGGRDGFRLTDTYEGSEEIEEDTTFQEDFTLSKAKGWSKTFEYLPQIEESDVDPKTGTQTIYVYSYYLEETGCTPADFYPVFSSSTGAIGNESDRIEEDTTLTATNVQRDIDVTLRKVDESDVNNDEAETLEGAAFKIVKYTSGTFQGKDTSWGSNGEKALTEKANEDGVFTVDGLTSGYYQIVETAFPTGYVQVSANPYIEVAWNSASGEFEVFLLDENKQRDENNKSDLVRIDLRTIVVGNTPGAELPHSGGAGTTAIYLIGAAMTAAAAFVLALRRKQTTA